MLVVWVRRKYHCLAVYCEGGGEWCVCVRAYTRYRFISFSFLPSLFENIFQLVLYRTHIQTHTHTHTRTRVRNVEKRKRIIMGKKKHGCAAAPSSFPMYFRRCHMRPLLVKCGEAEHRSGVRLVGFSFSAVCVVYTAHQHSRSLEIWLVFTDWSQRTGFSASISGVKHEKSVSSEEKIVENYVNFGHLRRLFSVFEPAIVTCMCANRIVHYDVPHYSS